MIDGMQICTHLAQTDFIGMGVYTAPIIFPVVHVIAGCAADNKTSNSFYPNCVGDCEITEKVG